MSCSIKRFKCDTNPEKVVNTENVKRLNNDLAKLMAERSLLDNKYFPTVQQNNLNTIVHSVDPILVPSGLIIKTKKE
jgi:hypothetical protein